MPHDIPELKHYSILSISLFNKFKNNVQKIVLGDAVEDEQGRPLAWNAQPGSVRMLIIGSVHRKYRFIAKFTDYWIIQFMARIALVNIIAIAERLKRKPNRPPATSITTRQTTAMSLLARETRKIKSSSSSQLLLPLTCSALESPVRNRHNEIHNKQMAGYHNPFRPAAGRDALTQRHKNSKANLPCVYKAHDLQSPADPTAQDSY